MRYIEFVKYLTLVVYNNYLEVSVVLISNCIYCTVMGLLNKIHLNIFSIKLLRENQIVCDEVMLLKLEVLIVFGHNRDSMLRVVSDDDADNIVGGVNICPFGKVLEEIAVLVKLLKPFDVCFS